MYIALSLRHTCALSHEKHVVTSVKNIYFSYFHNLKTDHSITNCKIHVAFEPMQDKTKCFAFSATKICAASDLVCLDEKKKV